MDRLHLFGKIFKELGGNAKKVISLVGKDIIISQWKLLIADVIINGK